MKQAAIVLWAGFLGAIPSLLVWLSLVHDESLLSMATLAAMFFGAWICATLSAAIAMVLSWPWRVPDWQEPHGR